MKVYFFGVWTSVEFGHALYQKGGWQAGYDEGPPSSMRHEGFKMCPRWYNESDYKGAQGQAALHHSDGWTALAWWDQTSGSTRAACSILYAEGVWTTEDMLAFGREHCPAQMARQTAPIVCVARPTEVSYEAVVCWKCKRPARRAVLPGEWSHDPPGWLRREKLLACSPGCAE